MPFSDFYFSFKSIFPFLKSQKRVYLPADADMPSGSARKLTWHAGPPRGCDVALRPCSRAAGGPRDVQVAHKAQTCGRRPRGSTRMPVGVPRGRGSAYGGPTG